MEIPVPKGQNGQLLIRTVASLISSGTERMMVEFSKASYLEKARQQPDKVKQVLQKIKSDGLVETYSKIKTTLDQPLPLGYCNTGVVVDSGVPEFKNGDRVISNGPHAEYVRVPKQLCAKIPDGVDYAVASFTIPSAVGLQGIRLLQPLIGETVAVFGLGLIGLLSVQILKANGCRVIGIDTNSDRCKLAGEFGAQTVDLSAGQNPIQNAMNLTNGIGVDGVLVTAATESDEVMHQAAEMSRKQGRIVLVGVVGLNLRREDFYKKELTFQVSASYGPGRYDPSYEEEGHDYPLAYVRWTEQRNFEAVLALMGTGVLDPKPLITHSFELKDAAEAYNSLVDPNSLGIALSYPQDPTDLDLGLMRTVSLPHNTRDNNICTGNPKVSFLGAGNYANSVLIPAFKTAGADLRIVASSGGFSAVSAGKKFGFSKTTTDEQILFNDADTETVVVATRHDTHAEFVLEALRAGKNVFVEKPLCLNLDELSKIKSVVDEPSRLEPLVLMVGFNRRFAPQIKKIKELLRDITVPKSFIMTVNAGALPPDHWTQDTNVGGGRIAGEACHFIDLLRFLAGTSISEYSCHMMDSESGDSATIQLAFRDGSVGSIHYFANGNKAFPKERLEVFADGGILQLDNFTKLTGFGGRTRVNKIALSAFLIP
jgi:predicted dehydrogenase/threonine dehydrogenase-like Zn-dependent dehydrogenase